MIFWNQARKRKEFKPHKRVTVFASYRVFPGECYHMSANFSKPTFLINNFCFPHFLLLLKHTNIQNDSFNFSILPFFLNQDIASSEEVRCQSKVHHCKQHSGKWITTHLADYNQSNQQHELILECTNSFLSLYFHNIVLLCTVICRAGSENWQLRHSPGETSCCHVMCLGSSKQKTKNVKNQIKYQNIKFLEWSKIF